MNDAPLVSIVIPVFNGANFLREAIDSALAQTYPHVEVLVVNDGSTDDGATATIATSYGDRIRYFEKENGGVASALNLGIREMRGEYFSWLSHDDVYLPRKTETQIAFLGGTSRLGQSVVVYADYEELDLKTDVTHSRRVPAIPSSRLRFELLRSHPVDGSTVLIHRGCFDESVVFDAQRPHTQDYHLWFQLAGRFEFLHVPEVVSRRRLHAGQGSRTNAASDECEALFNWMLEEIEVGDLAASGGTRTDSEAFLRLAHGLRVIKMAPRPARRALVRCLELSKRESFPVRLRILAKICLSGVTVPWGVIRHVVSRAWSGERFTRRPRSETERRQVAERTA